jgi:DNA-binding transcriptional ArsR family regulator
MTSGHSGTRQSEHGPAQLATLMALAEPNRFRIVELLRAGPLTVGEVATRLAMRQPQASKHLRVLTDAGILEVRPDANRRIHALRPEPFEELEAWLQRTERTMTERFDKLDDYLRGMPRQPGGGPAVTAKEARDD